MPTGTLFVNPRRGGKSRVKRKARSHNRSRRRNPLLTNPLLTNPRRRKAHGRKRRNPFMSLLPNPRRGKRRNPLLTNPIRIRRRRNPSGGHMLSGISGMAQKWARKIPLVGGVLGLAIGSLGAAVGGAVGVLPTSYLMPHIDQWIPEMVKPYAYTLSGALLSALVTKSPVKFPYQSQLAIGVAAAGGAVDMVRWRAGKSQQLGLEEMGSDDMGDEFGEVGDDGSRFAATEYSDADLSDADYMGDDMTGEEIAAAELGRSHYWRKARIHKAKARDARNAGESSGNAGKPFARHGWLAYLLGFDAVQELAKMPENQRRAVIAKLKFEAKMSAKKLMAQGEDTSVESAETAGILIAA